jgi:hypothetical protein
MLRKLAIVEFADLLGETGSEQNICTADAGFESSSKAPRFKLVGINGVSKRQANDILVVLNRRKRGDQDICDSADHTFAGHFFVKWFRSLKKNRNKRISA